ncbi:TIGR01777 family oxidoreductase [Thermoplasma volcanium]|nr:TIGR01777 family oxidoreductase [Thermoplasma volcanium]
MKVVIFGGTGLIGRAIYSSLPHDFYIVSRSAKGQEGQAHIIGLDEIDKIKECDVVINLSGYSIASKRWNRKVKEEIVRSRIDTTRLVVNFIRNLEKKPSAFLSGSAIGFYGHNTNKELTEEDPFGSGFLADLARSWEEEAMQADGICRTVLLRTANFLSPKGGFLSALINPKSKNVMYFGDGRQPVSWMHYADYVKAVEFVIENASIAGPVNMSSPQPVTFKEFAEAFSKSLGSHIRSIPEFLGKIALGSEMYRELMSGQKVIPKKLIQAGFKFDFPDINTAASSIASLMK